MTTTTSTSANNLPTIAKPRYGFVLRVLTLLTIVSFLLLVVTGLIPLMFGTHVGGTALLVHVGMGGLFAFCLALLAIAFSSHYAFDVDATCQVPPFRKVLFWLFVAGGLSLIISSVLMMMPLFGSPGQATLVAWHRRTSYIEIAVALLFAISLLTGRRKG